MWFTTAAIDILWYLEIDSYILSCKSITPTKRKKESTNCSWFSLCLLIFTRSPRSGPGVKKIWNSEVCFAKYDFLKGPGGSVSWEVFHPKAHTLRTSSLVKEPRFFNAVDIASFRCEKMRKNHQVSTNPLIHVVAFFCFLIWNNIVSMIFVDFARKLCTKILGCRSTNFSEFSCACRYYFRKVTAWWYQRNLIKERNIKDTQNWKQAHDLVTSTLPNLSPDLTLSIPPGSSNRCCRCRKSERLSECVAPSGCPC